MIVLGLVLGLFQGPPTVGDTVWLSTRVPLAPRQILRPQTWDLGDLGQVLGAPVVELGPDSATVSYPVSFWYPGGHAVSIPGPIVVNGMLYVPSGYGNWGGNPGNVLLAFGPK